MIELRWLEEKRKLVDETGLVHKEWIMRKLQYRTAKLNEWNGKDWSDWIDVPTVEVK